MWYEIYKGLGKKYAIGDDKELDLYIASLEWNGMSPGIIHRGMEECEVRVIVKGKSKSLYFRFEPA